MSELEAALSQIELPDDPPPAVDLSTLKWSPYQLAIFDFVKTRDGNAVVEAVAGSGKSTTIVEALKYTDPNARVALVAFNKRIADSLRGRCPDHVHVSTLHSLGLRNIRRAFPRIKVDKNKMWKLLDQYKLTITKSEQEALKENASTILRLVALMKATLLTPTPENKNYIVDHYDIIENGHGELIFAAAKYLWEASLDTIKETVNFDDMIFAPAYKIVECEKFDFLFVDEAQDLNKSQIEFVLNSVANDGRVVAVGDRFQSCYGFRGADTDAIPKLIHALNATTLPLTITYRCPTSVVKLAQEYVPHLEARENAPRGKVKEIYESRLIDLVKEGDLVICRTNAPLVSPAFSLIRNGIKAVVLGREIGRGLTGLIGRIEKRNTPRDTTELLRYMQAYTRREIDKLVVARKTGRALSLQDKFNTIVALADGCDRVSDIRAKIDTVFSDSQIGITFSSIHKIKGGEAERVFILRPDLLPHPMAKSAWQRSQEDNLSYIAITRAKSELYFVIGE